MALRQYTDMSYSDDDILDMPAQDSDAPEYPCGLCFSISEDDLEKAGESEPEIGAKMRFSAMADVTSVMKYPDGERVELRITDFAGEDGKFFELSMPCCICLTDQELEKLCMDADCRPASDDYEGDMLHMIGTVRIDGVARSEFGSSIRLQITEMSVEDESEESREC